MPAAPKPPPAQKKPVKKIKGKPTPERPERALFCLPLKNPLRKLCIDAVEWKYPFLSPKRLELLSRCIHQNVVEGVGYFWIFFQNFLFRGLGGVIKHMRQSTSTWPPDSVQKRQKFK